MIGELNILEYNLESWMSLFSPALRLENTLVSDLGLAHIKAWTGLYFVDLEGTQVSDGGLEQLKGLIALQELRLGRTQVTHTGVARLQQALPNCKISY